MRKTRTFLLFILCLVSLSMFAQNEQKYWVVFSDKEGVTFDPAAYFHPLALERRALQGLPTFTETDLPVRADYLANITPYVKEIKGVSRWLNAACVWADQGNIEKIALQAGVAEIIPIQSDAQLANYGNNSLLDAQLEMKHLADLIRSQTALMGIQEMHRSNFKGNGIRVAIFDTGFPKVDEHPVFEHIRKRNGIVATYDFVRKKEDVYKHNDHGTMTFSCVAGVHDGLPMGFAVDAEFLLAITERAILENFSEEENWVMAAEWADKNGAHVINSSLGYTQKRYFQSQMDGSTALVSRAANIAASKGILVVNSAGNEGDENWTIIGAPADADSVLTVGGFNPWTGLHTTFGSFGPTADGRMKPNVTAPATVIAQTRNAVQQVSGTSFSSPLTAGFAAALLSKDKSVKVMDLFRAIERSGHLYPYFDYANGFGVPQGVTAIANISLEKEATFDIAEKEGILTVRIKQNAFQPHLGPIATSSIPAGKRPRDSGFRSTNTAPLMYIPSFFYWHLEGADGQLTNYYIVQPRTMQEPILEINTADWKGKKFRCFYQGYLFEKQF
jgi:serine protease AprX